MAERSRVTCIHLPDSRRNTMDAECRDIFELSCEKGFRAIIDEAAWHLASDPQARTALVEKLAALSNHFERSMVTFLDHNAFWKGATRFYRADSLPYWRKRKHLPHQPAEVDDATFARLSAEHEAFVGTSLTGMARRLGIMKERLE